MMGMLEDDLSQFPPVYERKVHLYWDQKGELIPHSQRAFANTLCKGNFPGPELLTTLDPEEVTCKICLKDGRMRRHFEEQSRNINAMYGKMATKPVVVRVLRVLEYVGERSAVERVLQQNAVKGFADFGPVTIRETMLPFPEELS